MKHLYRISLQTLIIIFLIFHFSFFISVTPAHAHVLKSDGSVGAILHVSPDDDPIAGVSTDFFFELKDKDGKFTPENCDCTAVIRQNGKEIYSQPLFQNNDSPSLDDASFAYVIPQKDIYAVAIIGEPKTAGAFQPFTLSWDIRVAREEGGAPPASSNQIANNAPYIVVLALVLFVVGITLQRKKKAHK